MCQCADKHEVAELRREINLLRRELDSIKQAFGIRRETERQRRHREAVEFDRDSTVVYVTKAVGRSGR